MRLMRRPGQASEAADSAGEGGDLARGGHGGIRSKGRGCRLAARNALLRADPQGLTL